MTNIDEAIECLVRSGLSLREAEQLWRDQATNHQYGVQDMLRTRKRFLRIGTVAQWEEVLATLRTKRRLVDDAVVLRAGSRLTVSTPDLGEKSGRVRTVMPLNDRYDVFVDLEDRALVLMAWTS